MGYGKRAIDQLISYYSGAIPNLNEDVTDKNITGGLPDGDPHDNLLEENIKPRKHLPPLLLKLNERRAEKLDYLGVSYGLTSDLLR